MTNTFEILAQFLDRFGDDVEGRQQQEPGEDIQARLWALARGQVPAAEQPELLGLLNRNPHWLGRLAEEVKALRVRPG
jgi:hypothetical protein